MHRFLKMLVIATGADTLNPVIRSVTKIIGVRLEE
jgi:hypothetical protein